jgi:hypothetical protein
VRVLAIAIALVCIAAPAGALARPKTKIAVAPFTGDPGGKVAAAVAEALADNDTAVVGPKQVAREMKKLGIEAPIDGKATRKLVGKLGVVAVIDGEVGKADGRRSLHLEIHRRGHPSNGFTAEFKSVSSKLRKTIHDEVDKRLEGAGDDRDEDEEKPAAVAEKRSLADDDAEARGKRTRDDDAERDGKRAKDEDAERDRKRKVAEDDAERDGKRAKDEDDERSRRSTSKSRRVAADDDDERGVRKRRARRGAEEPAALATARVAAGGAVAQRELSWQLRSGFTQIPPRVLTYAGSGRVDGEIYPFALAGTGGNLAGLGLAAAYDKTFGLSIKIPNQTVKAPIDQSHYALGVRYRIAIGDASSVALGLDYARRRYVADRGGLMGATLDAPDVDYTAVSPVIAVRFPVTDAVAVFAGADGLLVFEAGGIQKSASYGPAKVYGIEGAGGVDIALAKQIGLRIALEYSQIMFSFTPKGATLANNRDADATTQDVMGATDRSIGGTVTLGLAY